MTPWNIAPQFLHVPQTCQKKPKNLTRPKSEGATMRKDETAECVALNRYLLLLEPRCDFIYTFSGNGGLRNYMVAAMLKACGLRAGVWDYYFRRAGRPTHWLEMKFGKNGVSHEQEKWRDRLEPAGDTFSVAWTAEEALKQLVDHDIIPPGMVVFYPNKNVCIRMLPPDYM